jgi:hypothetical protein
MGTEHAACHCWSQLYGLRRAEIDQGYLIVSTAVPLQVGTCGTKGTVEKQLRLLEFRVLLPESKVLNTPWLEAAVEPQESKSNELPGLDSEMAEKLGNYLDPGQCKLVRPGPLVLSKMRPHEYRTVQITIFSFTTGIRF